MDRREAVAKLGAAGAIAAGGSIVLSSRVVAFAASGECLPDGVPSPINMPLTFSPNKKEMSVTPTLPLPPTGVTVTSQWSGAGATGSTTGPVAIQGGTTNPTVVLVRPSAQANKWNAGDTFTVTLVVTWSCGEVTTSVGEYVLVYTLTSSSAQNVSVPVAP